MEIREISVDYLNHDDYFKKDMTKHAELFISQNTKTAL